MKHAYLIMAHQNTTVLQILIQLLDDERNDIYIHIDQKSNFDFKEKLSTLVHYSTIYFTERREKIYWAHYSQVIAEYILFEDAFCRGGYQYYHLLSGSDLPIKPQEEIHQFFDTNCEKEFIGFSPLLAKHRICCKHLMSKHFRTNNSLINHTRQLFINMQVLWQKVFPKKYFFEIKKGTNWVSVTNGFVEEMLKHKNYVLTNFKYTKSLDEFYKQTIAYNTKFRDRIYSYSDEYTSCMRLIDWHRGGPYSWQLKDFEEIQKSNMLFCRKIDDEQLAKRIAQMIKPAKTITNG